MDKVLKNTATAESLLRTQALLDQINDTERVYVTRPSMPSLDEYVEEIEELWRTKWLTNNGTKHMRLADSLKEYLGVSNIDLFTNGHMALELSLQALHLSGEVITTPFTFASTTHAIVRNNLTPVFCDIRDDDYTIDTSKIESLITEKTTAILPVHVYGNICDVYEIQRIADQYGLKVIYDAAHAFGERIGDKGVGEFGDISCFSFHSTKVFNTIEGGAAAFSDGALGEILWGLKNFGIFGPEDVDQIGANAKMNEFCAAMGLCNLRHIDEEIKAREHIDEVYRERLSGVPGIKLNPIQAGIKRNYAYFPILIEEEKFGAHRDEVYDCLSKQGIVARKYFYPITNAFACYADRFSPETTPVAKWVSERILTLPMYASLNEREVHRICNILLSNCR